MELLLRAAVAAKEGVARLQALAARLLPRHASSLPAVLEQWPNVQAELGRARDQALSELRRWLHQQEKAMEGAREAAATNSEQLVMFSHLLDDAAVRGDGEELITSSRALLAGANLISLHRLGAGWVQAVCGDAPSIWKLHTEAVPAAVHIGGPGARTFLWSDCATAAEHNIVSVACVDEEGDALAWIREDDVSVCVTDGTVLSVAVERGVVTLRLDFDADSKADAGHAVTVSLLGRLLPGFPHPLHCAVGIRGRKRNAFVFYPSCSGVGITVTADGRHFAIPDIDCHTLSVFDSSSGDAVGVSPPVFNYPASVCATPRNTVLVASLEGMFVAEASLEGKILRKLGSGTISYTFSVATNGAMIAVGTGNGVDPSELTFYDYPTGDLIRVVNHPLFPASYTFLSMAGTGTCVIIESFPDIESASGRLILVRGENVHHMPALPEKAVSAVFADAVRDDVLLVLDAVFCVRAVRAADSVTLQRWDCTPWLPDGLTAKLPLQLVRAGPLLCVFASGEFNNSMHIVVLE